MKRFLLAIISLAFFHSLIFSQIRDTVYYDLEGEIMIKEVASIYRVAELDTTTGFVIGTFKDFQLLTDSLIGSGLVMIDSISGNRIENFIS